MLSYDTIFSITLRLQKPKLHQFHLFYYSQMFFFNIKKKIAENRSVKRQIAYTYRYHNERCDRLCTNTKSTDWILGTTIYFLFRNPYLSIRERKNDLRVPTPRSLRLCYVLFVSDIIVIAAPREWWRRIRVSQIFNSNTAWVAKNDVPKSLALALLMIIESNRPRQTPKPADGE